MTQPLSPFAFVLHCALFVLIIGGELYRNRASRFDYLTLFSTAYLLNYAVVPLVYQFAGYSVLAVQVGGLKQPAPFELDEAAVDILLGYGMFAAGYFFGRDFLTPKKSPIVLSKSARTVGLALGAAGVASFILYAVAYGGVLGLIKVAPLIRSGKKLAQTALVSGSKFMGLTAFGLWAAVSGVFERVGPVRLAQVAFFGTAALFVGMANAGRMDALVYFVPVILLWATRGRTRIPIVATIAITVAIVLWVDWAKVIAVHAAGFKVSWETRGGLGEKFLEDFYPTYTTVPAALEQYYSSGRIFGLDDFGTAFVHLMPQHLLGAKISVYSSKDLNTLLVGSLGGGRPPGLIGWSIYSLGPGWFLLWPVVYGTLAGLLQSRYAPVQMSTPYAFCIYIGIGALATYTIIFDTDPTVYLNSSVWLILGIVVTEFFVRWVERGRPAAGRSTTSYRRLAP